MRIITTKKTKSVLAEIPKQTQYHQEGIREALHDVGEVVGRETKRLIKTGPKTGRIYIISGRRHQASAKGEPPANLTGRLMRSYNYRVSSWDEMTIGEEADYAKYLEDGTRKMAPRPHLIVAINNTISQTLEFFSRRTRERLR